MLSRRQLIRSSLSLALASPAMTLARAFQAPLSAFTGEDVLARIEAKAREGRWKELPIGERMGKIALELEGTPYVGHTIELDDSKEYCVINLKGLDCVTFFEDALDLARALRMRGPLKEAFIDQVRFTRYRGGVQGDFTTRLHYTTEWIHDNVKKGVVEDLTPSLPGARPFTEAVGFMSRNPEDYRQLKANPELIPAIKHMEDRVNALRMSYLPLENIADAEPLLRTGDIIGVAATEPGIDIAHTGMAYKDDNGVVHFMDASSLRRNMRVTLEGRLSDSLHWSRQLTGIMVARPLEVTGRR